MAVDITKNQKNIAQALFMLVITIFVVILLLGVAIFQANAWAQKNVYREADIGGYSLIDDATIWTSASLHSHSGITLIFPTLPSGHHDGPDVLITNTSSEDFLFIVPTSTSTQVGTAGSFIFPITVPDNVRRITMNISTDEVEILGIGAILVKDYDTTDAYYGFLTPSQGYEYMGINVIDIQSKSLHGGTSKTVTPYAAQITINLSLIDHNRLETGGYILFMGFCVDDASYNDNADIVYVSISGYNLESQAAWLTVDTLYAIFGSLLICGSVILTPIVNPTSKNPFQWPIPGNAKPKKGGK